MVGEEIFQKYGSLIVEKTDGFHAYPANPLSTEDRLQVVTLGWTFINDLYAMLSKKVISTSSMSKDVFGTPEIHCSGVYLSNIVSCSG